MARKLQVTVDKNLCVSNQWCIKNVPAVFKEDEAGQAEVVDPDGASEELLIEAGFNCPVGAIAVVDADTGEDLLA
jgi:ferredoxin